MRRAPSVLALVLMTLLLAACRSGEVAPPETDPTLVASDPADGSTGPVEQIRLEFSEPMAEASLELTLCTVPGDGSDPECGTLSDDFLVWSDESTVATWGPANTFAPATSYELQVLAEDLTGGELATQIGFSTAEASDETPPEIVDSIWLLDENGGIFDLTLVFSEPMDHSSVEVRFSANPPTTCDWLWLAGPYEGQESARCRTSPLEQDTEYHFAITTGATDLAGNTLADPFSLAVPVGNLAPRLIGVTPADGARFVGPKTPIVLEFNESVYRVEEWQVSTAAGTVEGHTTDTTFTPETSYGDGALVTWELTVGDLDGIIANWLKVSGSFTTRLVATPVGEP